jgi:peroxiredoxin
MLSILILIAGSLLCHQAPASGTEWQIAPKLNRGEELVYRGTFVEESTGQGVQHQGSHRLESRVFVMDATAKGAEVGVLTIVQEQPARGSSQEIAPPLSVRLELARVTPQGRIVRSGGIEGGPIGAVPLHGPAPIETGMFIDLTNARVAKGQAWETVDPGKPSRKWRVLGSESVNETPCVKLLGVQQSDDWDEPRGDRAAWRRRDTLWVAPNLGVALRLERATEFREPGRQTISQKTVTSYTLENRMVYPDALAEDRRREITLVHQLSEKAAPHLREPERAPAKYFDEVLGRVAQHCENHPATPYRDVVKQLKRRLEAARRGEVAPVAFVEQAPTTPTRIALGQAAPDFVVTELDKKESVRLRKLLGRPIVMVFYNPTARNAAEVLKFAKGIAETHSADATVLGFALTDEPAEALAQRDQIGFAFPVLSGFGLKLTYAVEATPKIVVLDAAGIVRGAYVGWGTEVPHLIRQELDSCQKAAAPKSRSLDVKERP